MLENPHIQSIHCIGIGGIGVGGVAELLNAKGYKVTGSDAYTNAMTKRLQAMGIPIYEGHKAEHVREADLVVYSSAIQESNPEIQAARELGIPVIKRAQMLAELMQNKISIAVSGTHGKTTTTGMAAYVLDQANASPSFMIGGYLNGYASPSQFGKGEHFVVEADESDASFLFLSSNISIVTNIDADHLETYDGNFSKLEKTFVNFLNKLPDEGLAILEMDDPTVCRVAESIHARHVFYGERPEADYQLLNFQQTGLQSQFTVRRKNKASLNVILNMPGKHNALNAIAIIALADELKLEEAAVLRALKTFPGTQRRFFVHGEIEFEKGSALVIDDYGHHPSEIKATLDAARRAFPHQRLVLAYQPHRYTRTRDLMDSFAETLSQADVLILLGVYSAGEQPIEGADSYALCHAIEQLGMCSPILVPQLENLMSQLHHTVQPNDVVILQGAGSIGGIAASLSAQKAVLVESP